MATSSQTTWQPHDVDGDLSTEERNDLPDNVFAFLKQRKAPLTSASHVRNALARFDQIEDVTDAERDVAWSNIQQAAKHYGVDLHEKSWRELMRN